VFAGKKTAVYVYIVTARLADDVRNLLKSRTTRLSGAIFNNDAESRDDIEQTDEQ